MGVACAMSYNRAHIDQDRVWGERIQVDLLAEFVQFKDDHGGIECERGFDSFEIMRRGDDGLHARLRQYIPGNSFTEQRMLIEDYDRVFTLTGQGSLPSQWHVSSTTHTVAM